VANSKCIENVKILVKIRREASHTWNVAVTFAGIRNVQLKPQSLQHKTEAVTTPGN